MTELDNPAGQETGAIGPIHDDNRAHRLVAALPRS